jgi:chromosome segregation and condensation protein ScpB
VGGRDCLDELTADIADELRTRPYDLVFVAGGYQLRTKTRFASAIQSANSGNFCDAGLPELTAAQLLAVTAIAYLQPPQELEISRLAGREISRDVIASLKRHGLIDGALRAPEPGAPFAYVTTKKLLEVSASRRFATSLPSKNSRTKAWHVALNSRPSSMAPWDLSRTTAKFSRANLNSKAPSPKTRPLNL